MASTVFELTVRLTVFTLSIAIATLPACADEVPCNAVTTCRVGKAKWIVNTTVTPSAYHESTKAANTKYAVEVRNHIAVKRLSDDMETVTSGSTSTAASCSFEETTPEDLGALLDAGDGALVTLVAGEARLTAHRVVLAARSPAFAAMLCHGSQDASSGQVRISDVEGPVLRQILAYLYTLQVPQLPGMAPQLLAAADKFGLSDLKSHSEAQVAAQLDVETAAATAVLAIKHSSTSLRQAAIPFIRANLVQVIATRGWADAVLHHPHIVIEVYRLLSETPVETITQDASLGSTPAAADSQHTTEAQSNQGQTPATSAGSQPTTEAQSSHGQPAATSADSQPTTEAQSSQGQPAATSADRQPTTEAQSSQGQTAATSAMPAPSCPTPPPDCNTCRSWRLTSEEKGERLVKAAKEGRVEEVEALLSAGADVGARDVNRDTALHWAAWEGHVEVARRLLGCGAEVGARNSRQDTPLVSAALSGRTAVARLLLAAGADPNARQQSGWTPLHMVAYWAHAETAAALLEWGADRGARNNNGETPQDLARSNNNQQVLALLT